MVHQAFVGAAALQRHFQRLDRELPIDHLAHRPADDETGEEIENRGEVKPAVRCPQSYPSLRLVRTVF